MTPKRDVNSTSAGAENLQRDVPFALGYPVTCLKFYANKDDPKADHHRMLAATCTFTSNEDLTSLERHASLSSISIRHSWLCQSLALPNSTVRVHIRRERPAASGTGFQLQLQPPICRW